MKNIGDLGVFHPKCMIIDIDCDRLSKVGRSRHVDMEDMCIKIIFLMMINVCLIESNSTNYPLYLNVFFNLAKFDDCQASPRIKSLTIET